jgi:hypothetical protein
MQLTIGSSRLSNTDGVVSVRGNEQIEFEWGRFDSKLLLTMDLYNFSGDHIARLRRNQWTFNDRDRFAFTTCAEGVSLVDTRSSEVVLEARVVGDGSVVVTQGTFHSCTGQQIEVTMEDWRCAPAAQAATPPAAESSDPTFAEHEIALIRSAVVSSQETVECPRCGGPLTRAHLPHATQVDAWLVSCIMCGRNLVVSRPS